MRIAIVAEAWGREEYEQQTAFVGWMSRFLNEMLEEAGIARASCFLTNVFNIRYDGKTEMFCGPKATAIPGYGALSKGYVQREIEAWGRVWDLEEELLRLRDELEEAKPNIIVAMGNMALWAFSGHAAISKHRGSTFLSTHTVPGVKVLPTYHPAAIAHQYSLRPTTVLDLMKAAREAEFPELRRPQREIWIEPTLADMETFYEQHILGASILSVDIETAGDQITCIGFSPSSTLALVIPFHDRRRKNRSFFASVEDEQAAWRFVARVLENREPAKLFQNGLYDISFLWRAYGIKVLGATHDTMLLHHALQPEALKGLGFLGSIYCDEGAWKEMREKVTTIKRDE